MRRSYLIVLAGALLVLLALLWLANTSQMPIALPFFTKPPGGQPEQVVGYFLGWDIQALHYKVKDLDINGTASHLTVLNYADNKISRDNTCKIDQYRQIQGHSSAWWDYQRPYTAQESVNNRADSAAQPLKGAFYQLKLLKARHPDLKLVITLGEGKNMGNFADLTTTGQVSSFVKSCIDLYLKGNLAIQEGVAGGGPGVAAGIFDGFDLDWEYPEGTAQEQSYINLLREFRAQLDALGKKTGRRYLLTVAAYVYPKHILPAQMAPYLNWFNLMGYDMHTNDQPHTNIQAPLCAPAGATSIESGVQQWLDAGVAPQKLVLGMPFYAYGWSNVSANNNGLYQSGSRGPDSDLDVGIISYHALSKLPGYEPHYLKVGNELCGYWLYNPRSRIFWSLDDARIIARKMQLVKEKHLAGAMCWRLGFDDTSGTLTRAIYTALQSKE